jgi:hypothetical protein
MSVILVVPMVALTIDVRDGLDVFVMSTIIPVMAVMSAGMCIFVRKLYTPPPPPFYFTQTTNKYHTQDFVKL